jgi:two-component system cell cycle response regulator
MDDENTLQPGPMRVDVPADARPCLIVLTGVEMGRVFVLEEPRYVIGRGHDADIILDGHGISRHHAQVIRLDTGSTAVKDLGSTNGTLVNGEPIEQRALHDGDRLQIGSMIVLRFSYQDSLDAQFQQHLYNSAQRDMLTGLYNRRFFDQTLLRETSSSRRTGAALSLLMLDIDHFKLVNDTHGHQQGDQVLRELGRLLSETVRIEDTACRLGGEEFSVIARNADVAGAASLAERLRSVISGRLWRDPDRSEPLTVSIGAATYDGGRHASPAELVAAADAQLYLAKGAGRNRVSVEGNS